MADQDQNANVVLTADTTQYQQSMAQAGTATQSVLNNVVALNTALHQLSQRAGTKLEILGGGTLAGLSALTVSTAKFESQMAQLNATATLTNRSFQSYANTVNSLRRNFALTTDDAIALVTQLNKMGQSQNDIKSMSETFIKLGAVTGESIGGLVDGLVSLQRQMGTIGSGYTERFASSLATLSQKAGVSATGILQFANSIAPIGQVAGMTQTQILGVSTAFNKAGQDGFAAANAFNTMLSNITRAVQYGSPDMKAYANLIGVTVDQFKAMPKSEAVTRIFEEITKQGPDASKTLERFGLDGMRTMKALQALASQGGLRQSIADATSAYNNTSPFDKAAQSATDGLNEQLQKMRNNMAELAQAMGAGLLPLFTGMAKAVNAVLDPITALTMAMGKLPGIMTAVGAAGVAMTGLLIKNFARLTGLGFLASLIRGPAAAGLLAATGGGGAWVRRAASTYNTPPLIGPLMPGQNRGGGGMVQRGLYNLGYGTGQLWRDFRGPGGIGEKGVGFPARLDRLLGGGIGLAGGFMRYGLEPLYPNHILNPFNRENVMFKERTPQEWWDNRKNDVKSHFYGAQDAYYQRRANNAPDPQTAQSFDQQAKAAAAQAEAFRNTTVETTTTRTALKALRYETGQLAIAMGKASVGVGMATAGGAVRMAGAAEMKIMQGVNSFLGGPIGVGLMAGTALYASNKQISDSAHDIAYDTKNYAAGNDYTVALGEAARATTSFADIVKANAQKLAATGTPQSVGSALGITPKDVAAATKHSSNYTSSQIGGMGVAEATSYASAVLSGATPSDAAALKLDLLKRFGGDTKTVQSILTNAQKNPLDMTGLFSGIDAHQRGMFGLPNNLKMEDSTSLAAKQAGDTLAAALTRLNDPTKASQATVASINQALVAFNQAKTEPGRKAIAEGLARGILGPNSMDDKSRDAVFSALDINMKPGHGLSLNAPLNYQLEQVQNVLASSGSAAGDAFKYARAHIGSMPWNSLQLPMWGAATKADQFPGIDIGAQTSMAASSMLGRQILTGDGKSGLSGLINKATQTPGDENLQIQTYMALADQAQHLTTSFSGAISELQKLKNASGTTSDAMYQLANNAQQYVQQRAQVAMQLAPRYAQTAEVGQELTNAYQNYQHNPGQESGKDFKAAKDAWDQMEVSGEQFFRQIYIQQRELGVQLQRAQDNYDLQKKRAQDQYDLQRKRQDRDYNLQRKYAEDDFNLQRQQAQDDFAHQQMLSVEQYSQSVYGVYQRIQVQQSWDAANLMQNLQEQQKAITDQMDNLATLRKAGLSSDVIKLLGLNQSQNAQQLARFTEEVANDPAMIKSYNKIANDRKKAAGSLLVDKDNTQWNEMVRSFNLAQDRGLAAFTKQMKRQADAYATQVSDQKDDFNKQFKLMKDDLELQAKYAKDDMSRMLAELTDGLDKIATSAIGGLTGTAKTQAQILYDTIKGMQKNLPPMLIALGGAIRDSLGLADLGLNGSVNATGDNPSRGVNSSNSAKRNQGYAKQLSKTYGWDSGAEWNALLKLWQQESSWNEKAQNASGAYGIPQALPSNKMAEVGSDWRTNPITQIKWGLGYIKERYTDPIAAWQHEVDLGWYGDGAVFNSGAKKIGVGERGPEAVMPLNQRGVDFLLTVMKQYTSGTDAKQALISGNSSPMASKSVSYYSRVDKSTNYHGAITVKADDPMAFARKMEADKRLKALTGGNAK